MTTSHSVETADVNATTVPDSMFTLPSNMSQPDEIQDTPTIWPQVVAGVVGGFFLLVVVLLLVIVIIVVITRKQRKKYTVSKRNSSNATNSKSIQCRSYK